jgi:hypothetical protein
VYKPVRTLTCIMATSQHTSNARPLPEILDWLVAGVLVLGGIAVTAAGSAVLAVVDHGGLAAEMSEGRITVLTAERTLSDAEASALATDLLNWTGIGLVVTGVAVLAVGVLYGVGSYRAHNREGGFTAREHGRRVAVVGAVATALLSFLPLSPVFGGGVAAHLDLPDADRSVRIGALAGALAAVPAVVILAFVTVGLYTGLSVVDDGWMRVTTVLLMGVSALVAVVASVGLGGLGGYAADQLVGDQ